MDHAPEIFAGLFAFVRAVHFAACLLAFGVWAFDRFVMEADLDGYWSLIAKRLILFALPIALISGAAWFAIVAINMSGLPPREALGYDNLSDVWNTQFGRLWKLRGALWFFVVAGSIAAIASRNRRSIRATFTWLALIGGGFLAASLAWSGHGQDGDTAAPWHLAADALHILIGGLWPIGLLPFAMLLLKLLKGSRRAEREAADHARDISRMTRRFSAMSLACVGILLFTGIVNSWFLVGTPANLYRTGYGRVLLIKIGLFVLMIGIGAINLCYLRPRLCAGLSANAAEHRTTAARRLQINVAIEIALMAAVLIVVGILGTLPPGVGMN